MFNKYFSQNLLKAENLKSNLCLTILTTIFIVAGLSSVSNASISVVQPTGGQNLSADLATGGPSAGYSPLGSIVINDGANNDFPKNLTNATIILTAPSNWQFKVNTGAATPAGSNITSASVLVTATTITITFSTGNTTSSNNSITISGIMVEATSGTALASVNITRTGGTMTTGTGFTTGTACAALSQVAGALNKFSMPQGLTSKTAGTAFSIAPITAQDYFGNTVTTFTGTVTFSTNATYGSVTSPSSSFTAGVLSTQNITVTQATSQAITATSGSATGTSNTFSVSAGAVNKLQVILPGETAAPGSATGKSATPNTQTAGTQFTITVNSVDANWNKVSATNNVSITSSDANAILPISATLVGGVKTFNVTCKTAAVQTVTATTTGLTTNSNQSTSFTVIAGSFAKLQLLVQGEAPSAGSSTGKTGTPSSETQGAAFTVTVNGVDAYWNVVSTATDNIQITSTDGSAVLPSNAALSSGTQTFSVMLFTTGKTITATDATNSGGITLNTSPAITVTAFVNVNTDYFQSIANGNWSATSTWQASHDNMHWYSASLTPDYNSNGIQIISPYAVTVTGSVTVDQVTVYSGAQVRINDGITLTVNNSSSTVDFDVYGTVQVIGTGSTGGSLLASSGANITFENGGLYNHNFSSTSTQGSLPTATWADGSTCEVTGFVSGTTIHIGNIAGQSFYHFTWNCANQTGPYGMQGALTTIRGDFTVQNSGNQIVYGLGASNSNFNMTIGGDLIINSGGVFDFLNSGATYINQRFSLTIGGNYYQNGGTFQSDYTHGVLVHFTGSGKSFTLSAGTFTSTNMSIFVDNGASLTLNNGFAVNDSFTVSNGGTLYCGNNTITGSGKFYLLAGSTLGIGATTGIAASGSSGNIQTSTRSFGNANYIYNAATSGNTGAGLPLSITSLTVNLGTTGTLTLTNTGNLAISNLLSLQKGILANGTTEIDVTNASITSISNYSVSSYVSGYLRRTVSAGNSYDFPVGTGSNYELATINLKSFTGISTILGYFNTGLPATGPNPATCFVKGTPIANMLNAGYWTITPNAFTAVDYDITLNEMGYTNTPGAASNISLIKRHNSSDSWHGTNVSGGYDGLQGNYSSGNQSISGGIASSKRTDVKGFSDYGIGYAGVPLPIELSSFNAFVVNNSSAELQWNTQSETNNNYFAIERSGDGITFDSIGMVNGAGTSVTSLNYSFNDNAPLSGVSYYRLKQVDFNGTFTFSTLVSVTIQDKKSTISQKVIFGNGTMAAYITSEAPVNGNLLVVDGLGRVLSNKAVTINQGVNNEELNINSSAAGVYFSVLQTSSQTIVTEFFFKP